MAEVTLSDTEYRLCEIADTSSVSDLAVVGAPGEWRDQATIFPAIILAGATVREFARVHAGCVRATVIGTGSLIMAGAHVGHDAVIGEGCEVAPNAVIGGCCTIGDRVKIGIGAVINPNVSVGDGARIGSGAVANKDIPAGETWVGVPARRIR